MNLSAVLAVAGRELQTVVRTRSTLAVAGVYAALVVGIAWTAGVSGYLSATLDLLTPMEALVPALALAFGYRPVYDDARSGELDVIRTYPVSRTDFVLGVYLGRLPVVLVVVALPLVVVAALVGALGGAGSSVIAAHGGSDTWVRFVRFAVLTEVFAAVALAVAIVVSAVARSLRGAIALGVVAAVALVVGLDLGIVAALGTGAAGEGSLPWLLAASPNSAYRGLVLHTVVGSVTALQAPASSVPANLLGLGAWLVGALAVAIVTVWPGGDA